MNTNPKPNDRISHPQAGAGTVLEFIPSCGPGHVDMLRVWFDDNDDESLVWVRDIRSTS